MKAQAMFRVKRVSYATGSTRTLALAPVDEFDGWDHAPEAMSDEEFERRATERAGFRLSHREITVDAPIEPGTIITLTVSDDGD